jgi:hypothetical protein
VKGLPAAEEFVVLVHEFAHLCDAIGYVGDGSEPTLGGGFEGTSNGKADRLIRWNEPGREITIANEHSDGASRTSVDP